VTEDQLKALLQVAGQSAGSPAPTSSNDQSQNPAQENAATSSPAQDVTTDASSTPTVSDAPSIAPGSGSNGTPEDIPADEQTIESAASSTAQ
jgi:hypothetical protein